MRKIGVKILVGLTVVSLAGCSYSMQNEDERQQTTPQETSTTADVSQGPTSVKTPQSEVAPEVSTVSTTGAQVEKDATPAEQELISILDEIKREGRAGTAGCSLTAVKLAAHLMNWGVGTTLDPDQIKVVTASWLQPLGEEQQAAFAENLELVRSSYEQLLGDNAEELLDEAGCQDAAYPWSDEPIETVEAVMQAVLGE